MFLKTLLMNIFLTILFVGLLGCSPSDYAVGTREAAREDAVPTLLRLTPKSRLMVPGGQARFNAVALYSDGSFKDVTQQAQWSSMETSIVSIDDSSGQKGLVRSHEKGNTSVRASYKEVAGGAKVTVVAGEQSSLGERVSIVYLDHSTGNNIWRGGVKIWFDTYNSTHNTQYTIIEQAFPKSKPYGWNNYPYDYWNIWVNHAGPGPYLEEPTLEMLTEQYQVIVFKHCYPVSNIKPDTGKPDISSTEKTKENYKLQYEALKEKMRTFSNTRFIVWTGAARVEKTTTRDEAERARQFFAWVKNTWDEPGDNIFIWDFHELETEGGLYLKNEYAVSEKDSHPNKSFSRNAAPLISKRIVDIIRGIGDLSSLTGR